jgi:hypothetical protein
MRLAELLSGRRTEMVGAWLDRIVDRYPKETAAFLRRQHDPFANPVGIGLREEVGFLVDGVLGAADEERVVAALDRIVRVRAVQELTPVQAVGFVLDLKELVRAQADSVDGDWAEELAELDGRVDRLLLLAFEVYSRCREQVYEIRVRAIHNRSLKVMERLNAWRARRDGSDDGRVVDPGG